MDILVVFGSKNGGTAGIARIVADALRAFGHTVEVKDAATDPDPRPFDAVIVGAGLYSNHWVRSARRFVEGHAATLERKPVWMFSSGPLDESARREVIPPVEQVRGLMRRTGARGHATFGGRLVAHPRGILARWMARRITGDWRDPEQIRAWANDVARSLASFERVAAPAGPAA
jgi:menaquinone-dependent protoporphyrinogen oxidase